MVFFGPGADFDAPRQHDIPTPESPDKLFILEPEAVNPKRP